MSKKVDQYDLDGYFIKTWPSIKAAAESVGCHPSRISRCCKGERKTVWGYIWVYRGRNLFKKKGGKNNVHI